MRIMVVAVVISLVGLGCSVNGGPCDDGAQCAEVDRHRYVTSAEKAPTCDTDAECGPDRWCMLGDDGAPVCLAKERLFCWHANPDQPFGACSCGAADEYPCVLDWSFGPSGADGSMFWCREGMAVEGGKCVAPVPVMP